MMIRFLYPFALMLASLLSLLPAHPAAGQTAPERGVFVVLVGADTIATERFTRTAGALEGEVADPSVGTIRYTAALGPDGSIPRIELSVTPPGAPADASPVQHATVTVRGDSVIAEITSGSQSQVQRLEAQPGVFPYLNLSFALVEQILRYAGARDEGRVEVPLFMVMGGQTIPATVTRVTADSATVAIAGTELHARTDSDGRLLGAAVPAQNLRIERVETIDAGPSPVPEPAAEVPARGSPVSVVTAGGTQHGTLELPDEDAPFPVALIIPADTASRSEPGIGYGG